MKKLLASVAVLGLAVSASAQDGNPGNYIRINGGVLHDGVNETAYKVQNPSGPSDYWNNDMDTDAAGRYMGAFIIDYLENGGFAGNDGDLRLCAELTAGVPDLSSGAIIFQRANPAVNANDGFNDDSAYTVPCTTLGSTDMHVVIQQAPGDSHIWIGCDTDSSVGGRTYFTTNGYSGGTSIPFSVDADMVPGEAISGAPGELLVNASSSASVEQNDDVTLMFFGPTTNTLFALYLCAGGNPILQLLPLSFTKTDNFLAGPCPGSWALTAPLDCNTPTGGPFEFCTIYADQSDTKGNGKAKLKLGTSAFLTITADAFCSAVCFGIKDDCVLDSTIWKVQNPAGASDWFNVNCGTASSGVGTLTGVSISSWDFCGFGPCWAEAGIYPANFSVDPAGCTPDVSSPLATVGGSSACMAPAAGDWGCPLTFYDTADVKANTTTNYHVASQWPTGDSCMWLGSDTDGIDTTNPGSGCGTAIPSTGCESLFTTNSYSSAGVGFTGANWMMQIDWTP
jgi:hypothetical protein